MKSVLIAALTLASGSAWAVEDMILENLRGIQANVRRIVRDGRWLQRDRNALSANSRDLYLLREQIDTYATLLDDKNVHTSMLEKLAALEPIKIDNGTDGAKALEAQLDRFLEIHDVVASIVAEHPEPQNLSWRETKHAKLINKIETMSNDILVTFTSAEESFVDVRSVESALSHWMVRASDLKKSTKDAVLIDALEKMGRLLEERHIEGPHLLATDATMQRYRDLTAQLRFRMTDLMHVLDHAGLNCELSLTPTAPAAKSFTLPPLADIPLGK